MATNPIEIPTGFAISSKEFRLRQNQQTTPVGSGFIQTIERSVPVWTVQYSTPPLRLERYNAAIAFLLKLDGAMNTFLAYDPRRPMPAAYIQLPTSYDPWTLVGQAAPRVTASSFSNSTVTLDRLANGAIITPGDYISFVHLGVWYLFRATSAHTVAGNTATVSVAPRPRLPSGFTATNIRYRKAVCEMKMIGGYEERDSVDSLPVLSFKAVQFINRTGS